MLIERKKNLKYLPRSSSTHDVDEPFVYAYAFTASHSKIGVCLRQAVCLRCGGQLSVITGRTTADILTSDDQPLNLETATWI